MNICTQILIIIFARRPEFLENLVTERGADLSPTIKMKLLNIEAAASLLMRNDYKGSHLPGDSSIYDVPLAYSKNKQILVTGLLDALKSLIPSETYVRTGVDTKMGFVIGEFGLKNIESKITIFIILFVSVVVSLKEGLYNLLNI